MYFRWTYIIWKFTHQDANMVSSEEKNVYLWIVSILNFDECSRYAFVPWKRDWNSLKICSFIWLDDEKYYVCIELKLQLVHWTERETSDFRELIVDTTGFSHFWIIRINDFVWSRLAAFLRSSLPPLPLQFLHFSPTKKKTSALRMLRNFIWQRACWKPIIWKIRTCSNKPDSS